MRPDRIIALFVLVLFSNVYAVSEGKREEIKKQYDIVTASDIFQGNLDSSAYIGGCSSSICGGSASGSGGSGASKSSGDNCSASGEGRCYGDSVGSWCGFNPDRYRDMSFYNKDGVAHFKGRIIGYDASSGVSNFTITTRNDITQKTDNILGTINPDGTFALNVPIAYPQYDNFDMGKVGGYVFLNPGDTLSIVVSLTDSVKLNNKTSRKNFAFTGKMNDAIAVNLLTDSIAAHFNLGDLYTQLLPSGEELTREKAYKGNEEAMKVLDSLNIALPKILIDLPVSNFAKDVISACLQGEICELVEELELDFNSAHRSKLSFDAATKSINLEPGESLDVATLMVPRMRHKDVIYNNPLLLCKGWILPSRWAHNYSFAPIYFAAQGQMTAEEAPGVYYTPEDYSLLREVDAETLRKISFGNCFVAQLIRTSGFINNLVTTETPSLSKLDIATKLLTGVTKLNEYDVLDEALMDAYREFVKDVMIAGNIVSSEGQQSIVIPTSGDGEVLEKIISPYKGNVLYLDFWGIGCGPCRSGMIHQKSILEENADRPFKALYIADADDRREACEKWLRKEGIKGEHIFVSGDDWRKLMVLFNFSSLPYGVLIGKDGKIIKTAYHLDYEPALLRTLLSN